LSSPLWKGRGDEFFIDGCGSIDCNDGWVCGVGGRCSDGCHLQEAEEEE